MSRPRTQGMSQQSYITAIENTSGGYDSTTPKESKTIFSTFYNYLPSISSLYPYYASNPTIPDYSYYNSYSPSCSCSNEQFANVPQQSMQFAILILLVIISDWLL